MEEVRKLTIKESQVSQNMWKKFFDILLPGQLIMEASILTSGWEEVVYLIVSVYQGQAGEGCTSLEWEKNNKFPVNTKIPKMESA